MALYIQVGSYCMLALLLASIPTFALNSYSNRFTDIFSYYLFIGVFFFSLSSVASVVITHQRFSVYVRLIIYYKSSVEIVIVQFSHCGTWAPLFQPTALALAVMGRKPGLPLLHGRTLGVLL